MQSPTSSSGGTAPEALCMCASCFTPHSLPRPDPTQPSFQCQVCRLAGWDVKLFYGRRSFPQEHSTR